MWIFERFGLLQEYKIQKNKPKNKEELLTATFYKNLMSHFLIIPALIWFLFDPFASRGMRVDFESFKDNVTWAIIARDFAVALFWNDTLFYWSHRALHHPTLYWIHKKHHEYNQPVAQASEWAHPIEEVLCNVIPSVLGCYLMGSHLYVFGAWLILRMWKTLDAHSGYFFPFPLSIFHGLPGLLGSDMHDFHHEVNMGCYGAFTTFWDHICCTDRVFYEVRAKRAEKGH